MKKYELKQHVDATGSHFFGRATMRFFGDTMRNYTVSDGGDCWILHRRQPVKHKLRACIHAALNASRVPESVMQGDAMRAIEWKDMMEKGTNAHYHCAHEPSESMSLAKLKIVRVRLERILKTLL